MLAGGRSAVNKAKTDVKRKKKSRSQKSMTLNGS